MNLGGFLQRYIENPDLLKKFKRIFYAVLALLVVVGFFVPRAHGAFLWEIVPGFDAFYGLISTVLIILVSKAIGHAWLMKSEDYYD